MARPLVLFAPGAGAASSSPWMQGWAERLGSLGEVVTFDYPYMREGRRRPDRHDKLVTAHVEALRRARGRSRRQMVLCGKSMGGRIGCHVSLVEPVDALVCLGYPLVGSSGKVRDEVLLALRTPILFVQGTRDRLCPLALLDQVRRRMQTPSELFVVDSGDHSLLSTRGWLKDNDLCQADVDARVASAIGAFLRRTS